MDDIVSVLDAIIPQWSGRADLRFTCDTPQVGAIAGHIYYVVQDAWPRELWYPGSEKVEKGNVEGPIRAPRWM